MLISVEQITFLRKRIRKAVYIVHFETPGLVTKCVKAIDKELNVSPLQYTINGGEQLDEVSYESLKQGEAFKVGETSTETLKASIHSSVKYDLIGKLAAETHLTRNSIASVLQDINKIVFNQCKTNPEDFIHKASRFINEQKVTVIVEHLTYDLMDDKHSSDIFTKEKKAKSNMSISLLKPKAQCHQWN